MGATVGSQPPRHPFLDWPGPIAMAHRGGAGRAPENTMAAFQQAVDLGFRYLETDVRLTADGVLAAFHDDDLFRTCGRHQRISELPWRELADARVGGLEPIPRLEELLDAWPEARINIDCKHDAAMEPLAALVERTGALDRVLLGSFKDRRLRWLRRRLGPGLCTNAGILEVAALKAVGWVPPGPGAVQVPIRQHGLPITTAGFVRRCHARGLPVHVWTVDRPAEMRWLLDLGVDGIMTDQPTVLRDVLLERGQWA